EVARAMAQPLSNVDKITIVSTGPSDGRGAGANQITADIARMVAQVPELFETLTGVKVSDLMGRITGIDSPISTNGTNGVAVTNGAQDPSTSRAARGNKKALIEGSARTVTAKDEDKQD